MRTRRAMARAVLHLTGLTVELSFVLMASSASAATIPVTTTNDELNLHDGCSMREALMTVNSPGSPSGDCKPADAVNNVIALQRGKTYRLSLKGPDETGNQAGDLNVAGTVTNLAIAGHATIDATGLGDRLLSIAAGASVTISGLKLTGGYAPAVAGSPGQSEPGENGGGILNQGSLTVSRATVSNDHAGDGVGSGTGGNGGNGGGIYNGAPGKLVVTASTISGNHAGDGGSAADNGGVGGLGGGIYDPRSLTMTASTVSGNRAGAGGDSVAGGSSLYGGRGGSAGGLYISEAFITNSTIRGNYAGQGGNGNGLSNPNGNGGSGGSGGGVMRATLASATLLNVTVTQNGAGAPGSGGSPPGMSGAPGTGGGIYEAGSPSDESGCGGACTGVQNTIIALNADLNCVGPLNDFGGNLTFGDTSCPAAVVPGPPTFTIADPKLGALQDNGGPTPTVAIGPKSAARKLAAAGCPHSDQRGAARPQTRPCDAGAFQFWVPSVTITSPVNGKRYTRGARGFAAFRCVEDGIQNAIASCVGTSRNGHAIKTSSLGTKSFTVTAIDKAGNRVSKTVHYKVTKKRHKKHH